MRRQRPSIVQLGWEKWPISRRIEIASRFCSTANSLGIIPQVEHPKRGPDKAFHNPALCAVVIRGLPGNHGLCSNHAVEVLWPELPETSPASCAAFAPASRSNFWERPSRSVTLRQIRPKSVFTQTQSSPEIYKIALEFADARCRKASGMNQKAKVVRQSRMKVVLAEGRRATEFFRPVPHLCARFPGNFLK